MGVGTAKSAGKRRGTSTILHVGSERAPLSKLCAQYRYLLGLLEHFSSIPELAQMEHLPNLWNDVMLKCLKLFVDGRGKSGYVQNGRLSMVSA